MLDSTHKVILWALLQSHNSNLWLSSIFLQCHDHFWWFSKHINNAEPLSPVSFCSSQYKFKEKLHLLLDAGGAKVVYVETSDQCSQVHFFLISAISRVKPY